MVPLVIRPEAESDLVEARDWYNRQRNGLGEQFVDAAAELLDQIRNQPELFTQTYKSVRRSKLRRFPYVVYYRVLENRTEMLAVLHGSRDSRIWQRRTTDKRN